MLLFNVKREKSGVLRLQQRTTKDGQTRLESKTIAKHQTFNDIQKDCKKIHGSLLMQGEE